MYISKTKPTERASVHESGWALGDDEVGAGQPRPVAVVPSPSPSRWMTTDEIDDGWFLPDEPVRAAEPEPAALPRDPGRLDLNSATLDQLCQVPGVGRARARLILELRGARGQLASVDELSAVRGIGGKTLEQLRSYLRV